MIKIALSLSLFACQQELVDCNVVDFMSSKVQFEQFRETVLTLFKSNSVLQRLEIDVKVLVDYTYSDLLSKPLDNYTTLSTSGSICQAQPEDGSIYH